MRKLKFTIKNVSTTVNKNIEKADVKITNTDGTYTVEQTSEINRTDDLFGDFKSTLNSKFTVSEDYIKELVREGVIKSDKPEKEFVNVFNAIDNMLDTYKSDLKNIDTDMSDAPECLKVEKTTVLRNLIKTLDYLKNLRK